MSFDRYISPFSEEVLLEKCRRIRHVALDMDGTMYMGSTLFPFTLDFLKLLESEGIRHTYLTNNPTRSASDYISKLRRLGIDASPDEMYTSSMAMTDYLHLHHPDIKRLFVLGTPSMQDEFRRAGFTLTDNDPDDRPDALLVAFDTTLVYDRLCRAAWWAASGIPYFATNPDWVCPTDERTVLVDCGSLCKAIEGATGRLPDVVIGKPNPAMLHCIRDRYGLSSDEIAMCGDRIYTDVASAVNAGSLGVLVLSGETTLETALASDPMPDITARDISVFGDLLKQSRN